MCKRPYRVRNNGSDFLTGCGRCLFCRIQKRTVWTLRLLHEASKYQASAFITLTYSDEHLPKRGSDPRGILVKDDLQRYFKRLRVNLIRNDVLVKNEPLKYYACGEYGEKGERCHFHGILFGVDAVFHRDIIIDTWDLGDKSCQSVGLVEADSVRYVAGYVAKKLGDFSFDRTRPAPFQISSNGIGKDWVLGAGEKLLYDAALLFRGKKSAIPRYYREQLAKIHYPPAVEGMSERIYEAKNLALTDSILNLCPQFGGRSWSQLDESEKDVVYQELCHRGNAIDLDLRTNNTYKVLGQIAKKRRKL